MRFHRSALPFLFLSLSCQEVVFESEARLRAALEENQIQPLTKPELDPALVQLGEFLFFDKLLSGRKDISCSGCHHPALAGGDAIPFSIGTGGDGLGPERTLTPNTFRTARNATEIFNRGIGWSTMFWDSRVEELAQGGFRSPAGDLLPGSITSALAAQAMFPVLSREEMRGLDGSVDINQEPNELATFNDADIIGTWDAIMVRLLSIQRYVDLFTAAFPGVALGDLNFGHAAEAIAAYEIDAYTLLNSPFDRYLAGDDNAMSTDAKLGALLFFGKAQCVSCHAGSLLTDQRHHNISAPQIIPDLNASLDSGRSNVTGASSDRFAFRTPPLRNVTVTGPYMHNGAYVSLEDAVRHHFDPAASLAGYDVSQLIPELRPAFRGSPEVFSQILENLDPILLAAPALSDKEVAQLMVFLKALEDPFAALQFTVIPEFVPSGLSTDY